ncbi:isocitrate/isopropylmalate dehydrogenase family protein [Orrella sp. 11846]|uniref:isocitrate/isopropylmalate dehydrogenase family protein n=1 Tax=Orrella sp. 11846 TaxID=3409913 RepID=UPI003B5AADC0
MKLVVIPGDGIGPETVSVAVSVLQAATKKIDVPLSLTYDLAGMASYEKHGTTVRPGLTDLIRDADGLIMGPTTTHAAVEGEPKQPSPSGVVRKELDLYANIRPARTYEGMPTRSQPFDLVIVRENTEGFYADRNMVQGNAEIQVTDDVVVSMRRITRKCCFRIAKKAFELAMTRRKKVTIVHKANVLSLGDGMFMDACHEVAKSYPEVSVDAVIVDAMMALAIRNPERFDVIVTTNMFGDILSDLTAELAGSLGMAASLNAGDDHAMAQAAHGSAPDLAGLDVANPLSQVSSVAMLMRWYAHKTQQAQYEQIGNLMETAVTQVIANGQVTRDIGGNLGTQAVGDALLNCL